MKVLVTGAAGFIGFYLSKALLDRGDQVIGIDNLNEYYDVQLKHHRLAILSEHVQSKNFTFIKLALEDRTEIESLFNEHNFDIVVNLAAQAGVRYSLKNPLAYINTNIVGFANVLENCHQHKVAHLVYASTSSVYGANTKMPFSEHDSVNHPLSVYAASKKSNELMAHAYSHLYQLPTTGLRFFTVYGPWGRPDMALFKFTKSILENKYIEVYNNGKHTRDFTYIDDAVDAIIKTGNEKLSPKENFKIYNIGNGKPVKLMHYISLIENKLKIKAKIKYFPMQKGDVEGILSDNTKIKKLKTFNQSKIDVETGVNRFIDWFRAYHKI